MLYKYYLILIIFVGLLISGCDNSSKNSKTKQKNQILMQGVREAEIIIDMLNLREDGERMVYTVKM